MTARMPPSRQLAALISWPTVACRARLTRSASPPAGSPNRAVGTNSKKLTMLGQIDEWCPSLYASQPATNSTANRPELPDRAAAHTQRNATTCKVEKKLSDRGSPGALRRASRGRAERALPSPSSKAARASGHFSPPSGKGPRAREGARRINHSAAHRPRVDGRSARPVAADGDPAHVPALTLVVVKRVVLYTSIVPHGERPGPPTEPAGERLARGVDEELVEEPPRLVGRHPFDADRESTVDVEAFASGLRVGTYHWVAHHFPRGSGVLGRHGAREGGVAAGS